MFLPKALVNFCFKLTMPSHSSKHHVNHVCRYLTHVAHAHLPCLVRAVGHIPHFVPCLCLPCLATSCLATIHAWETQTKAPYHPTQPSITPEASCLPTLFMCPSLPIWPLFCQGGTTQPWPLQRIRATPHGLSLVAVILANPRTPHLIILCALCVS